MALKKNTPYRATALRLYYLFHISGLLFLGRPQKNCNLGLYNKDTYYTASVNQLFFTKFIFIVSN